MKKRTIITTLVVSSLLACGTAWASSSKSFNGFPVVDVIVNGKTTQGDVPAIILNGRTLVPLKLVGESLGANVTWDSNTKTVNVQSQAVNSNNDRNVNTLKLYALILDTYQNLISLDAGLASTLGSGQRTFNIQTAMAANDYFNKQIQIYNNTLKQVEELIQIANRAGIDISDMRTVLNTYSESIDYYKLAFQNIGKPNDNNASLGFDKSREAGTLAYNGYAKIKQIIISY